MKSNKKQTGDPNFGPCGRMAITRDFGDGRKVNHATTWLKTKQLHGISKVIVGGRFLTLWIWIWWPFIRFLAPFQVYRWGLYILEPCSMKKVIKTYCNPYIAPQIINPDFSFIFIFVFFKLWRISLRALMKFFAELVIILQTISWNSLKHFINTGKRANNVWGQQSRVWAFKIVINIFLISSFCCCKFSCYFFCFFSIPPIFSTSSNIILRWRARQQ